MLHIHPIPGHLLAMMPLAQIAEYANETATARSRAELYIALLSLLLAGLFLMVALITLVRMFRRRRERLNEPDAPRTSSYVDVWGSYRLRPQDIEIMEDLKNGIDLTTDETDRPGDSDDDTGEDWDTGQDGDEDWRGR